MSRRECKHGKTCGHEWCLLEDESGILESCSDYEDSGWRRPVRSQESLLKTLESAQAKLKALRPVFGQRETFERRANGYRGVIARTMNEIRRIPASG